MTRTKSTEEGYGPEVVLTRSQPSVMIKRDGKGVYAYEVKVYADTADMALDDTLRAVKRLEAAELSGGFFLSKEEK
jgi:hypothetical protein